MPCFHTQSGAFTFQTGPVATVTRQLFAHQRRVGVAESARHVVDDAFKRMQFAGFATRFGTGFQHIAELDFFLARAKQQHLLNGFGQVFKRRFQIKTIVLGQALQHGEVISVALVPALDGATGQADAGEGDDAGWIEKGLLTQAFTRRAGPQGRVEREQTRFEFADGVIAMRTRKTRIESPLGLLVQVQHHGATIGQAQRGFQALGQTGGHVWSHLEPINHHIDVVLFFFLKAWQVGQLNNIAIDAKTHKALGLHLGEHLGELAFAFTRHWGHHHDAGFWRHGQDRIHHLRHAGRLQGHTVLRAMRRASTGKQQTQVIVDFSDRADR